MSPVEEAENIEMSKFAIVTEFNRLEKEFLDSLKQFKGNPVLDQRWLSIAITDIERAGMAAHRAVANKAYQGE